MNLYQSLNNNKNILLIFGGFASHPSHFIPFIPQNYDLILLYRYQNLDFSKLKSCLNHLSKDCKITLVGFSMGVFIARVFMESLQDTDCFVRKIAINGTEFGIHSKFGIPPKLFKLTQKTFDLEVFKRNLFGEFLSCTSDFIFLDSPILREELSFFITACERFQTISSEIVWSESIVSNRDLVFNAEFQKNFWIHFKNNKTRILELDAPHFVFFNWHF
ncbi:pimeloyl-ACP methyl esterase BioG family protein [Helicobacter rodentium]|uniref:pimeloyl-ACP methyl esterase BioG family protein n=1 Tax=Helicobacter rodentium TaxID=59617 RepID=UPI0023563829|nr:pimeloyl-ACP methyl esterase BioG family protein [Helicobacter rodentium]